MAKPPRVTRIVDLDGIGWTFHLELGDGYRAETYVSRGLLDPMRPEATRGPLVDVDGLPGRLRRSTVFGPAGVSCDVEYGVAGHAMVGEELVGDEHLRAAVARLLALASGAGRPYGSTLDRDELLRSGLDTLKPGSRRGLQPIADDLGVDYKTVQRAVKHYWKTPAAFYAAVAAMRPSA